MFHSTTAPPINCTNTTFFSRNVTLSWTEPVKTGHNGQTVGYHLMCIRQRFTSQVTLNSNSTDTVFTITDVAPHSYYICNLSFINTVGQGPPTQCSFTTAQDSKSQIEYALIDLFYSTYCSNYLHLKSH